MGLGEAFVSAPLLARMFPHPVIVTRYKDDSLQVLLCSDYSATTGQVEGPPRLFVGNGCSPGGSVGYYEI